MTGLLQTGISSEVPETLEAVVTWKIISIPWDETLAGFDTGSVESALKDVDALTPVVHSVKGGVHLTLVARCPPPPVPRAAAGWRERLADDDQVCFDRLGAWRAAEAEASGRPAFSVLTNRAAAGLASLRPRSAEELLDVPGIGPVTVERFGEALLEILAP